MTRRTRLAALIGAPALIVALGLTAIEAWRMARPQSRLFVRPFSFSLADAIATGDIPHAYQYIRAGQDPNERIAVRHPELTRNRRVLVLPLEWAAATGQPDAVRMLLGLGARTEASPVCVAERLGHHDVARVLRTYAGEAASAVCDARQMYPFDR